MIALTRRRIEEAEASLCRDWYGLRDPAALAGTLAAEHMRALISGASHRGGEAIPSIPTARLLASARRAVELVWPRYAGPASPDDFCKVTLGRMAAIGDVVDTGSGQWLPGPLRFVVPRTGPRCLLVAGASAQSVHQALGVPTSCAGASRFVAATILQVQENEDRAVSVDGWLGHWLTLAGWTAKALAHHESRMEGVEGLPAEHLEVYAPDVLEAQRRTGRWIAAGQIARPLDGPRLCRPQDRYAWNWNRPFYLAHFGFEHGALTLRRTAPVSRDLTLRLCFGLDIVLQTPRRVAIVRERDRFWMNRPLVLPEPEARVYALGWKHLTQDNPDRLTFHADAMPFVAHALERLAIAPTIMSEGTA